MQDPQQSLLHRRLDAVVDPGTGRREEADGQV